MINYDVKHLGFDPLLPDNDCLIAIAIAKPAPYIFDVDSESRAKARSRFLVRSKG